MAPIIGETNLKDLKPYKPSWRIRVKILHMWTQFTPGFGETVDMIVCDESGDKMHVNLKKCFLPRYQKELKLGEWKIFDTFTVSACTGQFRVSKLKHKISFSRNTEVIESDTMVDSKFLDLADFVDVKDKTLDETVLIDILGEVVTVGNIQNVTSKNKTIKKLDFEIRDAKDERLACTLWEKFGEKVFNACQNVKGNDKIVVLIRFAKIHTFKGDRSITNGYEFSDVLINPIEYDEVERFMAVLPKDGFHLTLTGPSFSQDFQVLAKSDNFNDFPRTSIAGLRDSKEIGKLRIMATISAIETDWGSYYISHRDCNKKVELKKDIDNGSSTGKNSKKQIWWCESCLKAVTDVVGRYKVHVNVVDQTSHTQLMLFDSFAAKIIGKPASELLDGKFEEIEDPTDIPDALRNLCGKSFLFLTANEKENIRGTKDYYRVARVWLGNEITTEEYDDFESESVNDPSSYVSSDKDILMLTNTSENETGSHSAESTPSSKRSSDNIIEIYEQSSTTKKMCTRNVKNIGVSCVDDIVKIDDDKLEEVVKEAANVSSVRDEKVDLLKVKQERYKE